MENVPYAIFTCRANSHPFQERKVSLNEPVKIGRSVARSRPASNNVVFDCKVLSRNHALLWYENGKFYLKDTKSSNGTFANNRRLSKGSEESLPNEINSGDIVQFGVDVIENSRRVTHGCIVSQIRLFLPSGEEAKKSDMTLSSHLMDKVHHNLVYPTIQSQDLYQLHQYLQEALHREQMLEQKLALLQRLVTGMQESSEKSWQALIDEDKLLSRLEFLENQLHLHNTKKNTEEDGNSELLKLQEEKHNYETTSNEAMRKALQEKLDVQRKLACLERTFSNTEDECTHLRILQKNTTQELMEVNNKYQQQIAESQKISENLEEIKAKSSEQEASLRLKVEELEAKIVDLENTKNTLETDLEDAKNENKNIKNELQTLSDEVHEKEKRNLQKGVKSDENENLTDLIDTKVNLEEKCSEDQIDIEKTDDKKQNLSEDLNVIISAVPCDSLQTDSADGRISVSHAETQTQQLSATTDNCTNTAEKETHLKLEEELHNLKKILESREKLLLEKESLNLKNLTALDEAKSLKDKLKKQFDDISYQRNNEIDEITKALCYLQMVLPDDMMSSKCENESVMNVEDICKNIMEISKFVQNKVKLSETQLKDMATVTEVNDVVELNDINIKVQDDLPELYKILQDESRKVKEKLSAVASLLDTFDSEYTDTESEFACIRFKSQYTSFADSQEAFVADSIHKAMISLTSEQRNALIAILGLHNNIVTLISQSKDSKLQNISTEKDVMQSQISCNQETIKALENDLSQLTQRHQEVLSTLSEQNQIRSSSIQVTYNQFSLLMVFIVILVAYFFYNFYH